MLAQVEVTQTVPNLASISNKKFPPKYDRNHLFINTKY